MDWIDLAQDMDQWRALVKSNESSASITFWTILSRYTACGFSIRPQLHGVS
jgi:hypothetical protein